jgi:hypothetical protein
LSRGRQVPVSRQGRPLRNTDIGGRVSEGKMEPRCNDKSGAVARAMAGIFALGVFDGILFRSPVLAGAVLFLVSKAYRRAEWAFTLLVIGLAIRGVLGAVLVGMDVAQENMRWGLVRYLVPVVGALILTVILLRQRSWWDEARREDHTVRPAAGFFDVAGQALVGAAVVAFGLNQFLADDHASSIVKVLGNIWGGSMCLYGSAKLWETWQQTRSDDPKAR